MRDERFRFRAEGGWACRLRGMLAPVLLQAGSWAVRIAAAILGPRGSRPVERRVARAGARLAGVDLTVEGLGHIDQSETYVVVALHEGFADALALLQLPLPLRFAARDELFEWPVLGPALRAGGHPCVETSPTVTGLRRFRREAATVLSSGDSLVLFAQGTILGVEVSFNAGAARLARSLGHPVLPVVVTGAHRVWDHPYSTTFRCDQRIEVTILAPIPPTAVDRSAFRAVERRMKRVALASTTAPPRRFRPEVDGWWDAYPYAIDPDFPALAAAVADHRQRRDS